MTLTFTLLNNSLENSLHSKSAIFFSFQAVPYLVLLPSVLPILLQLNLLHIFSSVQLVYIIADCAQQDQAAELKEYEEKIHHLADQMISIDLDDGVKHNYEIFKDVLAKIK